VPSYQTLNAVEAFREYLLDEDRFLSNHFVQTAETGRAYVLNKIQEGIELFKKSGTRSAAVPDELDF
jgi:hypothetical protein